MEEIAKIGVFKKNLNCKSQCGIIFSIFLHFKFIFFGRKHLFFHFPPFFSILN